MLDVFLFTDTVHLLMGYIILLNEDFSNYRLLTAEKPSPTEIGTKNDIRTNVDK